jgi:hypothetical protein
MEASTLKLEHPADPDLTVTPYSPGRSEKTPGTGARSADSTASSIDCTWENPVARDQLLRLGERPIDDGALAFGELDPPPLGAREKPRQVNEHSGLLELVVVPAHRGQEFLAGRCAWIRVPFDHQHHPHVLAPSWCSQPLARPARSTTRSLFLPCPTCAYLTADPSSLRWFLDHAGLPAALRRRICRFGVRTRFPSCRFRVVVLGRSGRQAPWPSSAERRPRTRPARCSDGRRSGH